VPRSILNFTIAFFPENFRSFPPEENRDKILDRMGRGYAIITADVRLESGCRM
jgi:hypothetical protein